MRRHLKRFLPDHESVRRNRLLGPLRNVLGDPRLWHINRRGISLGLWTWLLTLGKPLALGLLVAAVSVSMLVFGATQLAWRRGTMLRARHRRRRRAGTIEDSGQQ